MKKQRIIKYLLLTIALFLSIWFYSFYPVLLIILYFLYTAKQKYYTRGISFLAESVGKTRLLSSLVRHTCNLLVCLLFAYLSVLFISNNFISLYKVNTDAMQNSYSKGDVVIISKLSTGRRISANSSKKYHRSNRIVGKLNYGDVILFNYPNGDTIVSASKYEDYYFTKSYYNKTPSSIIQGDIKELNVKSRPKLVMRLYGLPGDTLRIKHGITFAGNKLIPNPEHSIHQYNKSNNKTVNLRAKSHYKDSKGIQTWDIEYGIAQSYRNDLQQKLSPKNYPNPYIFPQNTQTLWNKDFLGPIYIPKKGDEIQLNLQNIDIYKRLIATYEGNTLEIKDSNIVINNEITKTYTVRMNYYWVMGDYTNKSYDSRYWGFVPENHIIGEVIKL